MEAASRDPESLADFHEFDLPQVRTAGSSKKAVINLPKVKGEARQTEEVDLDTELSRHQYEAIVEAALQTKDQDAEAYLRKVRSRLERVGIRHPSAEVRFRDLYVETKVYADLSRNLPSVIGFFRQIAEYFLEKAYILHPDKRKLVILDRVSGVLEPGRATLLLGPPSSGKSTLLKALAGALGHSGLKVDGDVTYNGRSFKEFLPVRTAAYVPQDDVLIGELTVRETFDFAARCAGAGTKKEVHDELRRLERELGVEPDWSVDALMRVEAQEGHTTSIVTEFILRLLGLGICSDTMIGNAMLRGVSGGQKKRVTSGESLVGPKRVLFMDEISTGLDSSTTYSIIKYLADLTHAQLNTTLIALLQPAPETFNLFDDVLLVAEGHIIYHGPVEDAGAYFEAQGFRCPERKGVADFLQEVVSKNDQAQYWVDSSTPWKLVTCAEFAQRFQESPIGSSMHSRLDTPFEPQAQAFDDKALVRTKYALSNKEIFKATWTREFILVKRNLVMYLFRFFQTVFIGIITAFTFFRTRLLPASQSSAGSYFSVVFFSMIMVMFDGASEMNVGVLKLPGFYRQRDTNMYPSWAFLLPTTILRVPYSLLVAVLWSCIVYYVTGLAPEASRFFYFMLCLFLVHNMGISLFCAVAALGRQESVATTGGSFLFLLLLMCGGFLLAKPDIPVWWVWFFWGCDPLSYAQKGLAVNEFGAPRWQNIYMDGPGSQTVGDNILSQRGLANQEYQRWLAIGVLIFAWVFFNLCTWFFLSFLSALEKPATVLPPAMQEAIMEEMAAKQHNRSFKNTVAAEPAKQASEKNMTANEPATNHSLKALDKELAAVGQRDSANPRLSNSRLNLAVTASRRTGKGDPEVITQGMVLPFEPLCLTFKNMYYYVALPQDMDTTDPEKIGPKAVDVDGTQMLQLLQDCSGVFQPGILTALVGSSGAGKTTLMDVLAGRKTSGKITGDIRVAGFPKKQETFARVMGYCEQFDIHSPNTTVGEALWISSRLRFNTDVSDQTVRAFVEEVSELVELGPLKNSLVGAPGRAGLSVEQRKRLTIAVELVANPSVVFMDEPTSGLDARAAAIVMRTVRNTVNTGRTVVCTIHQPSVDIFEAFDDLLLMKVGGQIIYHGPLGKRSVRLVDYFEGIPGVPKLAEGLNPATWMLQISTPGMEAKIGTDFAKVYSDSATFSEVSETIERLMVPAEGAKELEFATRYAQPQWSQFKQLIWRNWMSYTRNPAYNGTRFIFGAILGLLFGSILWQIGTTRAHVQDLNNILGALYLAMLFLAFINSMTVQPVVDTERSVSYRERAAGMYSSLPFGLASCLIEIPWNLAQAIIFCTISYFMIGFETNAAKFFWYLFVIFLTLFIMTNYGIMAVYLTPTLILGTIASSMAFGLWNLYAGFIIPKNSMPPWFSWFYYLNPISWSLYGILVAQLGDVTDPLIVTGNTPTTTVKAYLNDTYDYQHSFLGYVILIMIGYGTAFAFIGVLALRTFNYQKR